MTDVFGLKRESRVDPAVESSLVDNVADQGQIASYGVMAWSGPAVEGEVILAGRVPPVDGSVDLTWGAMS